MSVHSSRRPRSAPRICAPRYLSAWPNSPTALAPIGSVRRTQVGREATEPMREDIRLLGAILGDTVREQNGDEVFDLVERARVESFRVRRSEIDRAELARLFDGIDVHQAIPVIRAFTHFALLANVAEDIHRERRRAVHVAAGEPPQNSSLAATYLQARRRPSWTPRRSPTRCTGALVSPVITAHPTETRRRTVFDTQHRITELMRLRLHGQTRHRRRPQHRTELRRHILTLWQTALIRLSRLKIQDEIETGLRYYPAAFFEVIPQVNAEVRAALQARWPDADLLDAADPAARLVDRRRPRRQPERHRRRGAAGHRQRRLHRAGALLRRADRAGGGAVDVGAAGAHQRRAGGAGRRLRRAGPRRRAVPARAAGHPRPADRDRGGRSWTASPSTSSTSGWTATRRPSELLADLDVVDASLRANGSAVLADDRLARLREAVHVFGFHLSGLDMRQNSDVHEEVIAELLAWAGVHPDYASLSEADRVDAAGRRAGDPPAAGRRRRRALRAGPQGTRHRRRRGPRGPGVRPAGGAELHHLDVPVGVGHARGGGAAQGGGPARRLRRATPYGPVGIVPLFETIDDLQRGSSILEAVLDLPLYRALVHARGEQPGGDARLLRLQQGRRLPGGQLGAVPGRAGPRRDRPARPESGCGSSTVAAAPSAAVAVRATTPSWRSRRAR